MRISKNSIAFTLLCLVGILLTPIEAAESESFDLAQQRLLKSTKSGKSEKYYPTGPKGLKKYDKTKKDKTKKDKTKKDKARKDKKKYDKKGRVTGSPTGSPTTAPILNIVELELPICSECFGDVASAAAGSADLISELQISAASTFPFPVDPTLIQVDFVDTGGCSEDSCGGGTGGERNLQFEEKTSISVLKWRFNFIGVLNGQSLTQIPFTTTITQSLSSNQVRIDAAFSFSVGTTVNCNFEAATEIALPDVSGTRSPAISLGRTRYLGYLY